MWLIKSATSMKWVNIRLMQKWVRLMQQLQQILQSRMPTEEGQGVAKHPRPQLKQQHRHGLLNRMLNSLLNLKRLHLLAEVAEHARQAVKHMMKLLQKMNRKCLIIWLQGMKHLTRLFRDRKKFLLMKLLLLWMQYRSLNLKHRQGVHARKDRQTLNSLLNLKHWQKIPISTFRQMTTML